MAASDAETLIAIAVPLAILVPAELKAVTTVGVAVVVEVLAESIIPLSVGALRLLGAL